MKFPGGKPFYCGKTIKTPRERLDRHRVESVKYPKRALYRKLAECGKYVRVKTTEIVPPGSDWRSRERYWIMVLRAYFGGVNVGNGGTGPEGLKLSPAHIEAIRKACMGRKHTAEAKAKMSHAKLGRKIPKIGDSLRGRKISEETKIKISTTKRSQGRVHSEETREKMRAAWERRKTAE